MSGVKGVVVGGESSLLQIWSSHGTGSTSRTVSEWFFFIFILFYFSNVSISSTERKLLNDSLLISFFKPIFEDLKTFKKYFWEFIQNSLIFIFFSPNPGREWGFEENWSFWRGHLRMFTGCKSQLIIYCFISTKEDNLNKNLRQLEE